MQASDHGHGTNNPILFRLALLDLVFRFQAGQPIKYPAQFVLILRDTRRRSNFRSSVKSANAASTSPLFIVATQACTGAAGRVGGVGGTGVGVGGGGGAAQPATIDRKRR